MKILIFISEFAALNEKKKSSSLPPWQYSGPEATELCSLMQFCLGCNESASSAELSHSSNTDGFMASTLCVQLYIFNLGT